METACPSSTATFFTVPAQGAAISFSIFIASRIIRASPSLTLSPSLTSTFQILPGMGAITLPAPAGAAAGAADATGCGLGSGLGSSATVAGLPTAEVLLHWPALLLQVDRGKDLLLLLQRLHR